MLHFGQLRWLSRFVVLAEVAVNGFGVLPVGLLVTAVFVFGCGGEPASGETDLLTDSHAADIGNYPTDADIDLLVADAADIVFADAEGVVTDVSNDAMDVRVDTVDLEDGSIGPDITVRDEALQEDTGDEDAHVVDAGVRDADVVDDANVAPETLLVDVIEDMDLQDFVDAPEPDASQVECVVGPNCATSADCPQGQGLHCNTGLHPPRCQLLYCGTPMSPCSEGPLCASQVCFGGQCCEPDCSGKECGSDGCGGLCAECGAGLRCDEQNWKCECNKLQANSSDYYYTCSDELVRCVDSSGQPVPPGSGLEMQRVMCDSINACYECLSSGVCVHESGMTYDCVGFSCLNNRAQWAESTMYVYLNDYAAQRVFTFNVPDTLGCSINASIMDSDL